jgi:hypothetical protein
MYCAGVMTWGEAFPTSAGLAGVGSTSPARGRPAVADMLTLCLLRLWMISGNFLRAAQPVWFFAWPGAIFLRAGALQASLLMSCCIHVYIISSSWAVRPQLAWWVHISVLQIITFHHCTNLLQVPCPSCISYSLHTQPTTTSTTYPLLLIHLYLHHQPYSTKMEL